MFTRRSICSFAASVVLTTLVAIVMPSSSVAVPFVQPVGCDPITAQPDVNGIIQQNLVRCWFKVHNDNNPVLRVLTFRMAFPAPWPGLNFPPAVGGANAAYFYGPVYLPASHYYAFQMIRPPHYSTIDAGITQIDLSFHVVGRCGERQEIQSNINYDWDLNANTFGIDVVGPQNSIFVQFPACKRCNNRIDDDGDGLVDLNDPGCANPNDDDEFNYVPKCRNGRDDDGDGKIDLNDPGCSSPEDDDETNSVPACSNGRDDDGDWLIDMNDPGCSSPHDNDETNTVAACSNGRDDDGDWLVDQNDPGCTGPDDNDETNPASTPACSNGVDDDGDGLADEQDPGCYAAHDNDEYNHVPACQNGCDDDGDWLIDEYDPGCSDAEDNDEANNAHFKAGVRRVAGLLADRTKDAASYARRSSARQARASGSKAPLAKVAKSVSRGADKFVLQVDELTAELPESIASGTCEQPSSDATMDTLRELYSGQGIALERLNSGATSRKSRNVVLKQLITDAKVAMQQGMWLIDNGVNAEAACK